MLFGNLASTTLALALFSPAHAKTSDSQETEKSHHHGRHGKEKSAKFDPEDFVQGLHIEYAPAGTSCTKTQPPVITHPVKPLTGHEIPVPKTGLNYGYSSFDSTKTVACDHKWYKPPRHAVPRCTPAESVPFPKNEEKNCIKIRSVADYHKYVPDAGKSILKHACVILENFAFDSATTMRFKMPPNSFFGCRGTIVGFPDSPIKEEQAMIEYVHGLNSTIAGDHCLIYMQGEKSFNGKHNSASSRAFDISEANGLYVNGITIIQDNAPFFHINGDNILMEDCNVIAATPYPSNDRNADGYQIAANNFTLQKSFIQSGDDLIALRRTTKAVFQCLTTYYGHALAIGGVGQNDLAENVVFRDIEMVGPERAMRIKADKWETGLVKNVLYENIRFYMANTSGISLTQDYTNFPVPDGLPDTGVVFENIRFKNIRGSVSNREPAYLTTLVDILCSAGHSKGGCKKLLFDDVSIVSGDKTQYGSLFVNFDPTGTGLTVGGPQNITKYDSPGKMNKGIPNDNSQTFTHKSPASH
ncbi:pectin lyase fold/virulence factor [Protomyces lactucae-debilis]|uniref:Pectin lyase fold/virulence factor n=1 Tax=Protomyces lactucae-debilis TaxID=2754530 RepID=A0A1Y2EZF5_PROLT|nr:pectin lyase fold/virulence factor [Protomyces lactucae-debilis]ORY76979.1 pectin lyase fold/virulence factor [Protomyces lactucae-debilis]